jgi:hypothetical protein
MSINEYLKERVDDQIKWYSSKASTNKKWYIRLEILMIIFSVSIPFVSNFMTDQAAWIKHVVSFMGVAIAAITGLLALMKYRDNWIEFRATTEILKHERYMFLTKSGAYGSKDRFNIFVQTIENILSKEVANWKTYQYKKVEEGDEEGVGTATDLNRSTEPGEDTPPDVPANVSPLNIPPAQ